MAVQTGVVKWYNEAKGFGFIEKDEDGKDLFVHYKSIRGKLNPGDKVEFEIGKASKGPCATNVRVIEKAPVQVDGEEASEEAKSSEESPSSEE